MKRYSTPAIVPGGGNGQDADNAIFGSVDVYLASDVDAELAAKDARIAELEGLLRDIADQGPSDLLGDALVARIHRALMDRRPNDAR